jgi:hypothetical protein
MFTPGVPSASGVRRAHQTNRESDPSNLHVHCPYFLKSRALFARALLIREYLGLGQALPEMICDGTPRIFRENLKLG